MSCVPTVPTYSAGTCHVHTHVHVKLHVCARVHTYIHTYIHVHVCTCTLPQGPVYVLHKEVM